MLNNTYRESLLNHPYGYALYEPQSSKIMKPGALGYIDPENGRFIPLIGTTGKPIALDDATSLLENDLSQLSELHWAEPDSRSWGPKTSIRVNAKKINISADASLIPAGIPAEIGALYEFQSCDDFGAILMTKAPVIRKGLNGSRTYRDWFRQNIGVLLKRWPDIKDHGLIIVTSTYGTKEANINAWQDKSKTISIGFKASAVDVFEVAPSSEWYKASSDGGWIASKAESENVDQIVFFGGIYFKRRALAAILSDKHSFSQKPLGSLRSEQGEDVITVQSNDQEYTFLSSEFGIGQVLDTKPPEHKDQNDEENEPDDF